MPTTDDPYLCLFYESEEERNELSHRLREAGLDAIPWRFVDLRPERGAGRHLAAIKRCPRRLTDLIGAGSVATVAVAGPHWPLVAAVTLVIVPLVLMLWLFRAFDSPKVAAAG